MSRARALALGVSLCLAACASPQVRAPSSSSLRAPVAQVAPTLVIDSPAPGSLVRDPEIEVRGHFSTYDGRAWVYVESTPAQLRGRELVAHRVPVREGKMLLAVELTDGQGRKARVQLPLVVESPDRPREARLCHVGLGCLRYELRGRPRRARDGSIDNAVLVLPALGSDEHLDALWPDLVGPGRALDSRRWLIIGLVGDADGAELAGPRPGPDAMRTLIDELLATLSIDLRAPLIGASSYGVELALRILARPGPGGTTGPILLVGGHDRPFEEPTLSQLREVLKRGRERGEPALDTWRAVAEVMVPASYTPAYLAEPAHAVEHGLVAEARTRGLGAALVEAQAQHFLRSGPLATLERRIDAAFALRSAPLDLSRLAGRRVILVANREDRLISLRRVRALEQRLRTVGAQVSLRELTDPLGHSAFFRAAPLELESAFEALLGVAP